MKKRILFICTHNSARSQMAEGYMQAKYGDRFEVFSGGTDPTQVHPIAIEVMKEIGIDISQNRSKLIDEFFGKGIEMVITVCDSAQGACPFFPGVKEEIHRSFPDPSAFNGSDEEIRAGFRRVRDEIIQWIDNYFTRRKTMTDEHEIRKQVRKSYTKVVEGSSGCSCGPNSSCCGGATTAEQISAKVGYSAEEMGAVPDGSNLGLGCGNPLAHAAIHEGDTVLDLGSGAGFDCFLAARKVGKTGRVIGVDMTHEMLMKARENAKKSGASNVEFRLGEIEALPVADNSVDLIISNCVINLSPDKARVFREAYRVLKPGGLLMVSDIVLTRELPESVRTSMEAYTSCIAGASLKDAYLDQIQKAQFSDVAVLEETQVLSNLAEADPLLKAGFESFSSSKDDYAQIAESVKSVKVKAVKRK